MKKLIATISLAIALTGFFPSLAFAATDAPAKPDPIAGSQGLMTLSNQACYKTGDCTMCDVLQIVNNIIRLILGLVGALAFLALLWGGFQLMFKGTEWETMKKGKETLKYAFYGILLVFFSYSLVNFGLNLIVVAGSGQTNATTFSASAVIFGKPWNEICAKPVDVNALIQEQSDIIQ